MDWQDFQFLNGKRLEDVGKHLQEESAYNHNFYRLPSGVVVYEEFDEFYEMGDVYLVEDGCKKYIGYTDGHGRFFASGTIIT